MGKCQNRGLSSIELPFNKGHKLTPSSFLSNKCISSISIKVGKKSRFTIGVSLTELASIFSDHFMMYGTRTPPSQQDPFPALNGFWEEIALIPPLSDVNTIMNAIYQYAIDNSGDLPGTIPLDTVCGDTATEEVCVTGGTCTGLVDFSDLTLNEVYLVAMPEDPTGATTNGAGYHVVQSTNGRVTVCAPNAEESLTISVKR